MEQIVNFIILLGLVTILFNLSLPYVLQACSKPKPNKPKPKPRRFVGAHAGFLGCEPCPTGTLPTISEIACTPDWQRFTRVFFQKRTTPQDSFTPANIITQATWTTKITATDDTKIALTPRGKLKQFGITPAEFIRTTDTPTGAERTLGKVGQDKVSFMLENLTPTQFTELQNLFCFPLVVFFVTADNVIIAKEAAANNLQGFPVYGRIIMNTPVIAADQIVQPRNFMVEFTMEDVFWYSLAREYKTTFANLL
jgi:hypothetical protein